MRAVVLSAAVAATLVLSGCSSAVIRGTDPNRTQTYTPWVAAPRAPQFGTPQRSGRRTDIAHAQAAEAMKVGDWATAERALLRVLAINPFDSKAHWQMSVIGMKLEDNDRALNWAQRAMRNDWDSPSSYMKYGEIYLAQGNYAVADRAFRHGFRITREKRKYAFELANVYAKRKLDDIALVQYDYALRLGYADRAYGFFRKAEVLRKAKRFDEALVEYQQAYAEGRADDRFFFRLGQSYQGLERFKDARDAYSWAIALGSESRYRVARSKVSAKLKDFPAVIADLTAVLVTNPREAIHWRGRGDALMQLKQYHRAAADYQRAVLLDPSDDKAAAKLEKAVKKLEGN